MDADLRLSRHLASAQEEREAVAEELRTTRTALQGVQRSFRTLGDLSATIAVDLRCGSVSYEMATVRILAGVAAMCAAAHHPDVFDPSSWVI